MSHVCSVRDDGTAVCNVRKQQSPIGSSRRAFDNVFFLRARDCEEISYDRQTMIVSFLCQTDIERKRLQAEIVRKFPMEELRGQFPMGEIVRKIPMTSDG